MTQGGADVNSKANVSFASRFLVFPALCRCCCGACNSIGAVVMVETLKLAYVVLVLAFADHACMHACTAADGERCYSQPADTRLSRSPLPPPKPITHPDSSHLTPSARSAHGDWHDGTSLLSLFQNGKTPLHDAASNAHVEICTFLLQHGADPTARGYVCCAPRCP